MKSLLSALSLVGALASGAALAADTDAAAFEMSECSAHVLRGAEADQLIAGLLSVGAPSKPGALNDNTVTTVDRFACGPNNQGAVCSVTFGDTTRSIEKAIGLTRLLAAAGAVESVEAGRQTFTITEVFCRQYVDQAKASSCFFEVAP